MKTDTVDVSKYGFKGKKTFIIDKMAAKLDMNFKTKYGEIF